MESELNSTAPDVVTIITVLVISIFYVAWTLGLFLDWRKREFENENVRQTWLILIISFFGSFFYLLRVYSKKNTSASSGENQMNYHDTIKAIKQAKQFKNVKCSECNECFEVHALQINATCPKCDFNLKNRGFAAIGGEIEDVIDAVLEWMGTGKGYEETMKRYQIIREKQ